MHAATTAIFLPALLQGVLLLGGSGPSTRINQSINVTPVAMKLKKLMPANAVLIRARHIPQLMP
jgi:hypothetical protein